MFPTNQCPKYWVLPPYPFSTRSDRQVDAQLFKIGQWKLKQEWVMLMMKIMMILIDEDEDEDDKLFFSWGVGFPNPWGYTIA